MPALLISLLTAAGPLLRGSWDLWAQTLLLAAAAAGLGLWLAARIALGWAPCPDRRVLLWAAALAVLSGASAWFGPVASFSLPEWRWRLGGLLIFVALTAVSEDERDRVDGALRAAAWVLLALVVYQKLFEGQARPPASFLKENIFAGACLFFLPLAHHRRDYALLGGLLAAMLWTRSVGAWLALGAAVVLARGRVSPFLRWAGGAAVVLCAAVVAAKFRDPATSNRLYWWAAAWGMFLDRPLAGFGPGAFAYVGPSFAAGGSVHTLYAHQSLLETLAETGLPYTALWYGGLLFLLLRGGTHRSFGGLAVLIHSLWDLTLSIPANYWLLCYCAGTSIPESSRGFEVPPRWRPAAAVLVLALSGAVCVSLGRFWQADRLLAKARYEITAGGSLEAAQAFARRSIALSDHPESRRLAAELALIDSGRDAKVRLADARVHLERSALLNPYRDSTWVLLERVCLGLGLEAEAASVRERAARYLPKRHAP